MKLTIIGKYPPIEGGVSSRTYRLSHALARRGIEVSVVTNALRVEDSGRAKFDQSSPEARQAYEAPNLKVFSLKRPAPRHIPYSEAYLARLANLALKVIDERGSDLIYAHYLEPYGTAGLLVKKLTGIPLVLQHAGSDIYRLLQSEDLSQILARVLQEADGVFLGRKLYPLADTIGMKKSQILPFPPLGIDTAEFSPQGPHFSFETQGIKSEKAPVITYMGKAGQNKGVLELCGALGEIRGNFRLLLLTQGEILSSIEEAISKPEMAGRATRLDFLPPWEIPSVLRATSILVHLEYNFSVPIHFPIQPLEGIATGTPVLLSKEVYEKLRPFFRKTHGLFSIVEDPGNRTELRNKLEEMLSNAAEMKRRAHSIREELLEKADWEKHVDGYVQAFERLQKKRFLFSRR